MTQMRAAFLSSARASPFARSAASPWLQLAGFLALALLVRLPFLPFTDINWDEGLYRLGASALLHGHAPYLEVWDRKPVGVFVLLAAAQALFGETAAAMRIATALSVGMGGWCLAGIARALFPDRSGGSRVMGAFAGTLFVLYSVRSGGDATNTELFFVPLDLAGLWLLLTADGACGPRPARALAAGLLMGAALQVKYNAAFDIAGFGLMFLLLRQRGLLWPAWRRTLTVALPAIAGILLPTLAVLAWYGAIGHLNDWLVANIAGNAKLVGATAPPFEFAVLPARLLAFAPLLAGTAAAFLAAPWLAPARLLGLLALAVWLAGSAAALVFLRRFADYMMIQALPELCVGAAFAASCGAQSLAAWPALRGRTRLGPAGLRLAAMVLVALLVVAAEGRDPLRPAVAAAEIVERRSAGEPAWGDLDATVAAALRGRLAGDRDLYVFGSHSLGLYGAAGQHPPTSRPFVEHLWMNYAPSGGLAELNRVLAGHPSFIVVDDYWLPTARKAAPWPEPAAEPVFRALFAALAQDYVRDGAPLQFRSHGGGRIGTFSGVTVFRRRDVPPASPPPGLAYAADAG